MNKSIIKKCIEEAELSNMKFKIGAVIFKGSRILSTGHNEIRGNSIIHPKYKNLDCSIHAEQSAVLNIKDWTSISGASILIIRITKKGNFSLAYPCPMCQNMLKFLKLKKCFYSNRSGEIKLIKVNKLKECEYKIKEYVYDIKKNNVN